MKCTWRQDITVMVHFLRFLTENEQCFLLKNIIAVPAEIPEKYLRFKFFIITCYNRYLCAERQVRRRMNPDGWNGGIWRKYVIFADFIQSYPIKTQKWGIDRSIPA